MNIGTLPSRWLAYTCSRPPGGASGSAHMRPDGRATGILMRLQGKPNLDTEGDYL